jgi:myosin-crossreactive antigen
MKQFDNVRAHKPEGIEDRRAYIVGGGIAGLASAVFLIDDCYVPAQNITIYDELPVFGGSMDGVKVGSWAVPLQRRARAGALYGMPLVSVQ